VARGQLNFRKTDVVRAIDAVTAAGKSVARVVFDKDGGFAVVIGELAETAEENRGNEEWDSI